MNNSTKSILGRKLISAGILLFLFGLITGFAIPMMQNPRMGLSSHLEGVHNGMQLILFGIIWHKLRLSDSGLNWGYRFSLFGTYTNGGTTFLAGIWGAGASMMPNAGENFHGVAWQEGLIKLGLLALSIAMLIVSGILLWGLRGPTFKN
jgi:hydroxylaminobenzene mutase